jgi:hypothetical protein
MGDPIYGQFGKSIASSHTASLSSNDRVVDAAFRQCGIVPVHDATTLGNDLKILHLPPMRVKGDGSIYCSPQFGKIGPSQFPTPFRRPDLIFESAPGH